MIEEEDEDGVREIQKIHQNLMKRVMIKSLMVDKQCDKEMLILPDDVEINNKLKFFEQLSLIYDWDGLQTPTMGTLVGAYTAFYAIKK